MAFNCDRDIPPPLVPRIRCDMPALVEKNTKKRKAEEPVHPGGPSQKRTCCEEEGCEEEEEEEITLTPWLEVFNRRLGGGGSRYSFKKAPPRYAGDKREESGQRREGMAIVLRIDGKYYLPVKAAVSVWEAKGAADTLHRINFRIRSNVRGKPWNKIYNTAEVEVEPGVRLKLDIKPLDLKRRGRYTASIAFFLPGNDGQPTIVTSNFWDFNPPIGRKKSTGFKASNKAALVAQEAADHALGVWEAIKKEGYIK